MSIKPDMHIHVALC